MRSGGGAGPRPFFATLALCGLRLGEALGLDVADVDFLGSAVTVAKQMDTEDPRGTVVAYTKTNAGSREAPMPPARGDVLAGARMAPSPGRTCGTPSGARLLRTVVDSEVRRIERRMGLT